MQIRHFPKVVVPVSTNHGLSQGLQAGDDIGLHGLFDPITKDLPSLSHSGRVVADVVLLHDVP